MGGKLTMTMSTEYSLSSQFNSAQMSEMATYSFSAAVSGWGVSASAAGSYAESVTDSSSSQTQFEQQTTKSSIITYGGAPGSFGPAGGSGNDAPANWGDWAQTVDLLPVPIAYSLDRIYNVLPDEYKPSWLTAESIYYEAYASIPTFLHSFMNIYWD